MQTGQNFLEANNICKQFARGKASATHALNNVSFTLPTGGLTALVGPDGAGKTTLLRIIAGLMKPDQGEVVFSQKVSMGYMPQKFGLYEDLSVQENMDLYADLRGLEQWRRKERCTRLLEMSAMAPFRERLAGRLSGGMKQKLGLICTLLASPTLLLLDEPTVGVDPLSRLELWDIIINLTQQEGTSVIVSTSYMDEAERCGQVVLLFEGNTLAKGTPKEIRALSADMAYLAKPGGSPRSLQARLLEAPGIIDALPQGGAVRLVHGRLNPEQRGNLDKLLNGASPEPASPSLEDSFMLLLKTHQKQGTPDSRCPAEELPPASIDGNRMRTAEQTVNGRMLGQCASSQASSAFADNNYVDKTAQTENGRMPVIETRHVSRFFGDFIAVNDVSFSVYKGEVFGLLDPNGAGKTTTFRMLCGLLPASKGDLFIDGVNVNKVPEEARRRLGYVAQKFSLYAPLSVRENLEFFAGAYGIKKAKQRINEVCEEFGLSRRIDMPAGALPGGYKQRLAMAVGLLHKPAILFLDEPTSGADPLARREFWKRISQFADDGITIIVTTHFMEEAEYCDRVLIQDSGIMLALDTPANIRAMAKPEGSSMEQAFISIVQKARAKGTEAS